MARVKNPVPSIRRRTIAFPLMLVSIALVSLIVLYVLDFKSQGLGIFRTQLDLVTEKFETVEKTYHSLLSTLLTKRSPVPEFTISVVDDSYNDILKNVSEIESTLSNAHSIESLREVIASRKIALQKIITMNKSLRAEELIGNSLTAYTSCKKGVNYRQKASQIILSLSICRLELDNAILSLKDLPKESTQGCSSQQSPHFYLQQTLKAYELLVSSYTYASKGKAKEAATTELAYQRLLAEVQQIPDWNGCISGYLQKTATELIGE